MSRVLFVAALATVGCHAVSGLEDLTTDPTGAGGTAAAGGAAGGPGTGGSGGGAGGGGGGAPFACLAPLTDDFADATWLDGWTSNIDVASSATQLEGVLRLQILPAAESHWAALASVATFDLNDCAVLVELAVISPSPGASTRARLEARIDSSDNVFMGTEGSELVVRQEVAGVDTYHLRVPFDAAAHRWWAIQGAGEQLSFLVSPDGAGWTALAVVDKPIDMSALRARLLAGANNNTTTFDVGFDNFNLLP